MLELLEIAQDLKIEKDIALTASPILQDILLPTTPLWKFKEYRIESLATPPSPDSSTPWRPRTSSSVHKCTSAFRHPLTGQAKNGKRVSERKRTRATSNASKGKQRRARKATPTMANNVEQDKQRQHWQTTTSKTSKASNGKKRHARQATPAANNTEQSPPNSQHHLKNCSKICPKCTKNLKKMLPKHSQNA